MLLAQSMCLFDGMPAFPNESLPRDPRPMGKRTLP
jgi:hypothetical protein